MCVALAQLRGSRGLELISDYMKSSTKLSKLLSKKKRHLVRSERPMGFSGKASKATCAGALKSHFREAGRKLILTAPVRACQIQTD